MAKAFIGRQDELELINRLWDSNKSELIILYGRRRIGKTRLLTHWMNHHSEHGLYWMAEPTSAVDQLRSFSQAIANFADPDEPAPLDFTYANWEQALKQVALLARGQRLALFIDEITYLMDINPAIIGTFQKVWDHRLTDSNVLLALSGSQMGLMQKQLLSYQAPLYGRSTAQMRLKPLPFGVTSQYFPNYSAADRVALYSIYGGVPAYWERIEPGTSVMQSVHEQLRPSNAWMLDEHRLLLQDFITDLYNYVGIMRAMANGAQTLSEIGKMNGLSSTHMTSYLGILRDTGFVERKVPVTQRNTNSRLGRYQVTDPYLRFYYRFLAAYQSKLAMGKQEQVLESIESNLPEFIEASTWKELCQEWLLRASANGQIPVPIEEVGGEWKRNFQIDVVGISELEKSIVLGCALWRDEPGRLSDIQDVVRLTGNVIPKTEEWNVYYVCFSANGWTADAHEKAETILEEEKGGRSRIRWNFVGTRLLDLEEVDHDLVNWSE